MTAICEITIRIGYHEITLQPIEEEGIVTESLKAYFTWHKAIIIHDWNIAKLVKAGEGCSEEDHIQAERQFIRNIGEKPILLGP